MTLPHGWTSRRFDQLGELCSGSTPSSTRTEFWDGATVWVTPTDLSRLNTPYLHDSAKQISERGLRNCSARLLPPGSIVLSSRAPIGYVAIPTVPFCTNQGCKSIALHNSYHSEFVYYAVTAAVPRLKRLGEGTIFAEISKKSLAKAEVVLPIDKAEQAKIAEVLSTVDRAIEQTEALIAKQQRIKTGLMQDLLTRGIDEHGNLRSEQTHAFKDSPLGRIPVEWECASFGDCWGASAQNGLYKPQSQYSDDGTPIIRIDGFRSGDLIDHQTFRRVRLAPAESRTFALEAGDLLVNRVNSIEWLGKAALVGSLTEATVFESNMMRIRVEQQWLISEFAILVLSSPHTYHHFRLCAKTAIAQASINQEDARSLLVALPHRVEQHRIVDAVQAAHRADGRLKGATLKLRLLRTGLMQDLLTGNRRVTPLLEECDRDTP